MFYRDVLDAKRGALDTRYNWLKRAIYVFIMVCVISDVLKGNKDFIPALGLWMTLPSRSTLTIDWVVFSVLCS